MKIVAKGFRVMLLVFLAAMFACPTTADLDSINQRLKEIVQDGTDEGSQQPPPAENTVPVDMDLQRFIQTFDDESENGFDCDLLCPDYEGLDMEQCLELCKIAEQTIIENRRLPYCEKPLNTALVPAGSFLMGNTDKTEFFPPAIRRAIMTKDIYFDVYEVTQSDFERVMQYNPAYYQGKKCGPQCPVESITWEEAAAYCSAVGKRLPTATEWEYAAKASSTTLHYWGSDINLDYLWYKGNSGGRPKQVGQKLPNAYGLYDMEGNVFEYVQDCVEMNTRLKFPAFGWKYPIYNDLVVDPSFIEDDCDQRLIKGSSFAYEGKPAAPYYSVGQDVNERRGDRGFRCVMEAYGPHCNSGVE